MCVQCGNNEPLPSLKNNEKYRLCETCYLKKMSRQSLGTDRHWATLREKLATQQYCCAYTGEALVLGVNDSLDHILPMHHFPDSARTPANVEWVTREINEMKRNRTPEQFLTLIHRILRYRESGSD